LRIFPSTKVRKSPGGVSQHAELVILVKKVKKGPKGALSQDIITTGRAVAGDVSKGPDGLLADIKH
jgi:hypothetical protein